MITHPDIRDTHDGGHLPASMADAPIPVRPDPCGTRSWLGTSQTDYAEARAILGEGRSRDVPPAGPAVTGARWTATVTGAAAGPGTIRSRPARSCRPGGPR